MTGMYYASAPGRRTAQAILALSIAIGLSGAAQATEPRPPSVKSKLLRDRTVTIIILDEDDGRSTSRIGAPSRPEAQPVRQPSGKIERDDDDVTIRIRRDRRVRSGTGGTSKDSGPKVIIVDGDSGRCKGGGVCVIRP